jgi:hypothetical protein
MSGFYDAGDLMMVEHAWHEIFALAPHKTVTGKWIWLRKIYRRRVWRSTGFAQEPLNEYGDLFEILE